MFGFDWSHLFSFKSIFHWPWTPDADRIIRNGQSLEMLAIGLIVYSICYVIQRVFNFLIYERFILNSVQQFIDICSLSNISMFIFAIDSYGYYIHGRYSTNTMCNPNVKNKSIFHIQILVSDRRMALLTQICAQCYNNCDVKARICAAIEDFYQIRNIKHFAFWLQPNWGKCLIHSAFKYYEN